MRASVMVAGEWLAALLRCHLDRAGTGEPRLGHPARMSMVSSVGGNRLASRGVRLSNSSMPLVYSTVMPSGSWK